MDERPDSPRIPSMTEKPVNLDTMLCFAIHSAAHAIQRANKPLLDKLGLTYPQYLVMVVLWAEDNQTVGSLGDRLFLESSTLTPLLKRLQAAGLVQRVRDAADERQVRVQLTEQGRALAEKAKSLPGWYRQTFCEKSENAEALRENITRLRDSLIQKQD
jgi:DNA-binding MarR family transcriptional regulator